MTAKWSFTRILRDHVNTLVDARYDPPRTRKRDLVAFYGFPIALGAVCHIADFRIRGLEGILSGVSIYAALLFGLLVQLFQLKVRLLSEERDRFDTVRLNDELESNVSYAVFMGVTTTALLIFAVAVTEKDHPASLWLSAVIVAFVVHLLLTLFMVLKRARSVYKDL